MAESEVNSQPTTAPTAPATPAAAPTTTTTTTTTTSPSKKGMSTGAKVAIGLCGGCLGLIIILGIVSAVAGTALLKSMPSFIQNAFEEEGLTFDENNGEFTITDDETDSSLTAGESIDLPNNFPSDIPVYEPADATFKMTEGNNGTVMFTTSKDVATVKSYYMSEMKKKGWTEDSNMEFNEAVILTYTKGDWTSSITVAEDSDDTTKNSITVTYSYTDSTE